MKKWTIPLGKIGSQVRMRKVKKRKKQMTAWKTMKKRWRKKTKR